MRRLRLPSEFSGRIWGKKGAGGCVGAGAKAGGGAKAGAEAGLTLRRPMVCTHSMERASKTSTP